MTLFISAGLTEAADNGVNVLNNGSDACAIGVAHSAITNCFAGIQATWDVDAYVSYYGGVWTVNFYGYPYCPQDAICILGILHLTTV